MFNVINLIPTGIGANIGGFAGDANPINSLLEQICDHVITHPNAVNAASLYTATAKTLYVEGFALDKFIAGQWGLKKSYNKIGIIIDKKAKNNLIHIVNALNSCKTVFGADITGYSFTGKEIGARVIQKENGLYSGVVGNKETIYQAAAKLTEQGANALAIFAVLENPYENADSSYLHGEGADPIGRLEAIISHLLVEKTGLPCAHAPIFTEEYQKEIVDPRVAAEEIGYSYIPCVIRGLQFSPQFIDLKKVNNSLHSLTINDVNALVVPYSSLGGEWLQHCLSSNIPVLAVKENTTVLTDTPENLGLQNEVIHKKIIIVDNYLEVMGILLAIKSGISWQSLRRPITGVSEI